MDTTTINEVERLAGLMFSADQVGLITGIEQPDRTDEFQQAILRGRLKEEALVRDSVFKLAKAGSAPAQALAVELIKQARVASAGE